MSDKKMLPFSWDLIDKESPREVVVFFNSMADAKLFDLDVKHREALNVDAQTATECYRSLRGYLDFYDTECFYVVIRYGGIVGWHTIQKAYTLRLDQDWYLYDALSHIKTVAVDDLL